MTPPPGFADKVGFVRGVADLLRGDFKAHEYGRVILPLVVQRRLECALAPTKDKVVAKGEELADRVSFAIRDPFDRMLVAQAQVEQLTLVTSDQQLAAYDVKVLAA